MDRTAGAVGFCRAGPDTEVYRYGPHLGEEPPVSGSRGSGTVFFGRCTLACLYCQNHPWSQEGAGKRGRVSVDGLEQILRELHAAGCHNWNFVSPTPWLPMIERAVRRLESDGISLPTVYNTSGFERTVTLEAYGRLADIALVDLRYAEAQTAHEASRARNYVEVARRAVRHFWASCGPLDCDDDGIARSGMICRLLILPGRAQEAVASLEWLAQSLGPTVPVSVMAQYLPAHRADACPGWDRRIRRDEYDRVVSAVERLGFETGWIQDFEGEAPDELIGFQMPEGRDGAL